MAHSGKYYAEINIDTEGTLNDLKYAFGKALPFALLAGSMRDVTELPGVKYSLTAALHHNLSSKVYQPPFQVSYSSAPI